MMTSTTTAKKNPMRNSCLAWAFVWSFQIVLGSVSPAWAQRRRAEPEASPSFTGEPPAGGPVGGEPVDSQESAGGEPAGYQESAGGGEEDSSGGGDEEQGGMSGGQQRVQIGAQQAAQARPVAPTNPLDTRIVVRVKNAPLSTFLDTISAQAKVNFIITEGLETKRVTAFLQNVSVREALQILLEIKGLTYQRIGRSNTYVVSPRAAGVPNRITRIYTLNHIPFIRVDAGTKSFAAARPSSGGGGAGTGAGAGGGDKGAEQGASGGIAVVNVIASVLSKKYGKISVDSRTNAIIVTDIPEVFPQVEQILAELDRKAPQVMIEAQIVEINSDRAQQLGLEWGGTTGELASFSAGRRDTAFPMIVPTNVASTKFFNPVGSYISQVSGNTMVIEDDTSEGGRRVRDDIQSSVLDLTSLSIVLRALVSRAEARFLGKPKILTLNNKAALIEVSQQQAVSIQQESSASAAGSSSGESAERFATGLTLKVTPQVNSEGYITMFVEPSFTNVIESKISSLESPVFDPVTRGASTLVRVKNGQTLVLGGLLESRETKTVRKVPFLGYIPLLGWLFTSNSSQRTNTDLVIFITPTIVTD